MNTTTTTCDIRLPEELQGRARPHTLDVARLRRDFPILQRQVHDKPLVYLDNAATTMKPIHVTEAIKRFYENDYANIHRGVHLLSQIATDAYECARCKVRRFIGAANDREIVFTRGATEAINLVAATYGRQNVGPGDEIVISAMEHHSNIVPWQMLCEERGARLRVIPMNDAGVLDQDAYAALLNERTRIVAIVHVSNALGTVTPIRSIVDQAHKHGVPVLVDGAQAVPHLPVRVQESDVDFYVFSAHKLYGPTGVGVLYGKEALLKKMPPYQGGGDMIESVSFEKTTYNELPYKFEAGTPNIAGVVGLGAAIDYLNQIGLQNIAGYEQDLLSYATQQLAHIPELRMIGTALCRASLISFVLEGVHPHDIGTILDGEGVAIRTGHHCAQPVMDRMGVPATARASFAFYNTRAEVDVLVAAIRRVLEVFG